MDLSFRHGIIRRQTDITNIPTFLQKSTLAGTYIDLVVSPDPTIITIAFGNTNYTIEETHSVTEAWGPFANVMQNQWLYWDIDLLTGNLIRGFTLLNPLFQSSEPVNPQIDQHWFDTVNSVMKVWTVKTPSSNPTDGKWVQKARLFAAHYDSSAIIVPFPLGTQAGLNVPCKSGYIVKNHQGFPLRDSDGTFLTTETSLFASNSPNPAYPIKFEAITLFGKAAEFISKFSLVSITSAGMHLGSYTQLTRQITGIVFEDFYPGEVGVIMRSGIVTNEQWSFPSSSIGTPLFCGITGELTTTAPTTGVVQQIGIIADVDKIYMDIKLPLYI